MCEQDRLISRKKAMDADVGDHFKREDCQGIYSYLSKKPKKNNNPPGHPIITRMFSRSLPSHNAKIQSSLGKVLVRHKLHYANPVSKDTIKPRLYFTTQIHDTK